MTDIEHQPLNNDLESNSKIEDNHYADVKPTIDVQAATTVRKIYDLSCKGNVLLLLFSFNL